MTARSYALNRDVPLTHEADVIVVGSGPGGMAAAPGPAGAFVFA